MILSYNDLPRTNPNGRGKPPRELIFQCDECNVEFKRPYHISHVRNEWHFCTLDCAYKHRKVTMYAERICPQCGKVDRITRAAVRNRKYCSQECYGKWRSEHADELGIRDVFNKPDIRAKAAETIRKSYKNGRVPSMLGKHHTDEAKRKMSEQLSLSGRVKGEKNGMYGRRHSTKSKEQMSNKHTQLVLSGRKTNSIGHVHGWYSSIKMGAKYYYRSSWERAFFEYLERNMNVKAFYVEPFRIKYNSPETRWYVPDVFVEYLNGAKILYEIKPIQFVNSKQCLLKSEAARVYCHEHGIDDYQILTRKELEDLGAL